MESIFIFLSIIILFELYRYNRRRRREKNAIYIELDGTFISQEIINKPYLSGLGLGRSTMNSLFILVYTIKDHHENVFSVNIAQSQYYNAIAYTESLQHGDRIRIRIKKYLDDNLYLFIENL